MREVTLGTMYKQQIILRIWQEQSIIFFCKVILPVGNKEYLHFRTQAFNLMEELGNVLR